MALSDEAFIARFEALTLPPQEFDHRGHLRLAWLYLKQYDKNIALQKIVDGIRDYATSLGAPDKFHYTLTRAICLIMLQRQAECQANRLDQFLALNSDLVDDIRSVVLGFYSPQRIDSEKARCCYLTPDLSDLA